MIFYEPNTNMLVQIEQKKSFLDSFLTFSKTKQNGLLSILEKVSYYIDTLEKLDDSEKLFSALNDLKISLDKIHSNIIMLSDLNLLLNKISEIDFENQNIDFIMKNIEQYNSLENKYIKLLYENIQFIEEFINNYILYTYYEIGRTYKKDDTQEFNSCNYKEDETDELLENKIETLEEKNSNSHLIPNVYKDNNVLLISEVQGKVFLPYKIDDLNKIIEHNKTFKDINELIEKNYVIPITRFRIPAIARFRESFELMKYKEKAPLPQCLSLSLELSMNSLLNPAIISACKNLDELDIYLDYLENNELEKFKIFEIKYEMFPAKIK